MPTILTNWVYCVTDHTHSSNRGDLVAKIIIIEGESNPHFTKWNSLYTFIETISGSKNDPLWVNALGRWWIARLCQKPWLNIVKRPKSLA